jgi:hypothetical protein
MADMLFAFVQFVMVLATWSYLFKNNVFSRMSSQIVIAVSTVHFFLVKMTQLLDIGIMPIFEEGRILNLVPIILGLLLYFRLSKTYAWLSSYTYAVSLGLGTGTTLSTLIAGSIVGLIISTIRAPFEGTTLFEVASGWLLVFGTVFALTYWIFTKEFEGPMAIVLRIGRLILMISIGLLYAQDVLWSQSLFMGAFEMLITFVKMLLGQG